MSGLSDSVSKVWTLELSSSGGLDLSGFKSHLDVAKMSLRKALLWDGASTKVVRAIAEEVIRDWDAEEYGGKCSCCGGSGKLDYPMLGTITCPSCGHRGKVE